MGTTHSWAALDGELNSNAGVTNVNFRNAPCDKPHNLCAQEGQKQIFYTRGTCVVRVEVKALFIERGWLDLNEPLGAWCASHIASIKKIALDFSLFQDGSYVVMVPLCLTVRPPMLQKQFGSSVFSQISKSHLWNFEVEHRTQTKLTAAF